MKRALTGGRFGSVFGSAFCLDFCLAFCLTFCLTFASAWATPASAQTEALHSLNFEIHDSLVGTGQDQMSLADWQVLLDAALVQARSAIAGDQGPADTACCTDIVRSASLATFSGAQFQTIDTEAEYDDLRAQEGAGVYIVLDISFCGTFSPSLLGCADTPGDFLVVDLDNLFVLGLTIAHERGHNTGLPHVVAEKCRLMSASNGGGCLSGTECQTFVDDANAAGDPCDCLDGVQGPSVADGNTCTHTSGCGRCSGGICGACTSEAVAQLFAAGDTTEDSEGTPTDLLAVSTLTGGYSTVGGLGGTINGLTYDSNRDVLWGVRDGGGSPDELVRIDPATGAVTSSLGVVGNPAAMDLLALAFDPNSDLLYTIEFAPTFSPFICPTEGTGLSVLRSIDPDNPTASTQLGIINDFCDFNGVEGLAYDSQNDVLWGTRVVGILMIDPGDCSGFPTTCASTLFQYEEGSNGNSSARGVDLVIPSGLAYEPTSGRLFKTGYGLGLGGVPLLEVIDAGTGNPADMETGELVLLMGTDGYTIGGLAAVPEPRTAVLGWIALATLAGLARRRNQLF